MQHRYHPFKGTFTDVKIHHGALVSQAPQRGQSILAGSYLPTPPVLLQAVGSTAESPDLPPYLRVSGIDAFWNKYNRRKGNPHHRVGPPLPARPPGRKAGSVHDGENCNALLKPGGP